MKRSETLNYKLGYKDGYKAALKTFNPISFFTGVISGCIIFAILLLLL